MKLLNSDFNISNSTRNSNPISSFFSKVEKMITQIWERVKGNQKPAIAENFVSYIKDHEFNIATKDSEVDFDIGKDFDSLVLWANLAVLEQESFTTRIIPMIKDANAIENFWTLQIEEELSVVNPKLNAAEEKAFHKTLFEQQSHKDLLINLQKEKEKDLHDQLHTLEQEFKEGEKQIANFESLYEEHAVRFLRDISHASAQFGVQNKNILKKTQKIVNKRKKFVNSVVKESSERLKKRFMTQSLKIKEEINLKFEEKEKTAEKNLEEKLQSIQENLSKEKQIITDLSDQKIKSLRSKIQSCREKLVQGFQSVTSHRHLEKAEQHPKIIDSTEELLISPETWQKMEAIIN